MFDTVKFCPIGPMDNRCRVNAPLFPRVRVRLSGKGAFAMLTPKMDHRGVCVRSIGMGKRPCSGDCVARQRVVSNTAMRFRVNPRPKGV